MIYEYLWIGFMLPFLVITVLNTKFSIYCNIRGQIYHHFREIPSSSFNNS